MVTVLRHSLFFILYLAFSILNISGQTDTRLYKIDSLTAKFKKDSAHIYRFKNIRPYAAIDNRNSFIKEGPVNVKGFQLGVILKEKHTVGFGLYGIQNSSKQNLTSKDGNSGIPLKRTLSLNYMTLFYQYVIIDKRFFELALPLEVGLGGYHIKLIDDRNDKIVSEKDGGVMLTSGGVDIVIKPLKWVGVSGSAGYRIALENNPNVNFNGAYYSYGFWVDVREIYRDIRFYGITRKKYRRQLKRYS
ncbi:MAG: hypothetical protein HY062_11930 [Bacteroidetes bacterium]|nr:hypothetical protein [Bacteroidota bacterium]